MNLNHILLYSKNLEESKAFYTKLGLVLADVDEDQVSFNLGGVTVQCFDESRVFFKYDSEYPNKGVGVFLHIRVDDVDSMYSDLINQGLKPSSEPTDRPWGNREFAIKDPDGYRWVFYRPNEA